MINGGDSARAARERQAHPWRAQRRLCRGDALPRPQHSTERRCTGSGPEDAVDHTIGTRLVDLCKVGTFFRVAPASPLRFVRRSSRVGAKDKSMAIQMMSWILAIPLLGIATGMRSMTPMAVLCWFAYLKYLPVQGTWASWTGHLVTVIIFTLCALGEFVGDKLPGTPSRTAPGPTRCTAHPRRPHRLNRGHGNARTRDRRRLAGSSRSRSGCLRWLHDPAGSGRKDRLCRLARRSGRRHVRHLRGLRHARRHQLAQPSTVQQRDYGPAVLPDQRGHIMQTARKPNSVLDDHSSRRRITAALQQPTRRPSARSPSRVTLTHRIGLLLTEVRQSPPSLPARLVTPTCPIPMPGSQL